MRWFYSEGFKRSRLLDEPIPDQLSPEVMLKQTDEELTQMLKLLPPRQPNMAIDLPLPVLQAVLAAPTSGFTNKEIQRLGWLKWQTHLLAHEARMVKEMVMLTFTVADHNHCIVSENVEKAKRGYRLRAGYTLDAVREALRTIES
jgi:hypothetical protein